MKKGVLFLAFLVFATVICSGEGLADDKTVIERFNASYSRTQSRVMMRFIAKPTPARLDAAAYLNNAMMHAPLPGNPLKPARQPAIEDLDFNLALIPTSIKQRLEQTPLTEYERASPMAWQPMLDTLVEWDYDASVGLLEVGSQISSEKWGSTRVPAPFQQIVAAYLHTNHDGKVQFWVKVEFQPGIVSMDVVQDEDKDGFPEIYGRIDEGRYSEEIVAYLKDEYLSGVLNASEVEDYFYALSSDWYEKYNTDTLDLQENTPWPNADTEPDIARELRGMIIQKPTAILKGKPFGKPIYNVFVVDTTQAGKPPAAEKMGKSLESQNQMRVAPPDVTNMAANIQRWQSELQRWGDGRWEIWVQRIAPFQDAVRQMLTQSASTQKGFVGRDGFLFFRGSLRYNIGGDLQKQENNPFPAIVDYARQLKAKGIDMLFVIIPAKSEIYPDKLSDFAFDPDGPYVNPYTRKFLLELAEAGVEVIDLYPSFITERHEGGEPIYMTLDTHWTNRGVRIAARLIGDRVKQYPWYSDVCPEPIPYRTQEAESVRAGDIRGMLTESQKAPYRPMKLSAEQVLNPDGRYYQDDKSSPIVVLGDSFTGVFHFEDCKHAGLTAHIAKEIGMPVDLIMAHGSGPRIRKRFARRGSDAIQEKRLVIWTTAARDLYEYWAPWETVRVP